MSTLSATSELSKDFSLAKQSTKVTPQHTLDRVRNNQRRHRERRRDHIATLETKLGEAENEIRNLEAQVLLLKKDLERCRCGARSFPQGDHQSADQTTNVSSSVVGFIETLPYSSVDSFAPHHTESSTFIQPIIQEEPALTSLSSFEDKFDTSTSSDLISCSIAPTPTAKLAFNPSPLPPSACCFPLPNAQTFNLQAIFTPPASKSPIPDLLPEPSHQEILALSPSDEHQNENPLHSTEQAQPDEGSISENISINKFTPENHEYESTMLCRQAYQLISTQNYKGLSQAEVVNWLSSGFRWPRVEHKSLSDATERWEDDSWSDADGKEEGCRVETTLLFGLLAFISDL